MVIKTKHLLLTVFPFLLVWMSDRLTKQWAENLQDVWDLGLIKFELVFNYGIMMGLLSHLPISAKTTLLTTLGAIILSSYIVIMLVAPISSKWLRLGLSILTAGIIGNVTDRLIGHAVTDFIGIRFNARDSVYLNLADIYQWIGYLFIVYGVYQDAQYYWPKKEWRNKIFINKKFQIRCGVFIGTLNFLVGFIFIIFGFAFFKHSNGNNFEFYYFICGFSILIFLSIIGFLIGVTLSHRIAGPIFAMEKYLNESLAGKETPFILRKNDEFKELQDVFTKLNSKINAKNK